MSYLRWIRSSRGFPLLASHQRIRPGVPRPVTTAATGGDSKDAGKPSVSVDPEWKVMAEKQLKGAIPVDSLMWRTPEVCLTTSSTLFEKQSCKEIRRSNFFSR